MACFCSTRRDFCAPFFFRLNKVVEAILAMIIGMFPIECISFVLIRRSFSFVFILRLYLTHVEQGYCWRLATFGFCEAFFLPKYEGTCWDIKPFDTWRRCLFWSFLAFLVVNTTVSGFVLTPVCLPSLKISSKNFFCFSLNGDLNLHDFSAHPWFSLFYPRYSSNFVSKVRFALKPSSKRFAYPCFGSLVGKEVFFTLVWMVSKT